MAGELEAGANCTHLISTATSELTFDQFIDFLDAAPATSTTPAKGAAICMSSDDFKAISTDLQTMCRMLGKRCSYESMQAINKALETVK